MRPKTMAMAPLNKSKSAWICMVSRSSSDALASNKLSCGRLDAEFNGLDTAQLANGVVECLGQQCWQTDFKHGPGIFPQARFGVGISYQLIVE